MKKIYLIGGGGHCKSCIDVIESTNEYEIQGIFDVKEKVGDTILGYQVIDTDENIKKYIAEDTFFLITVGQIKSSDMRVKIFNYDLNWATILSPRAYVSKHASVGEGTIVMHDVVVNAGVKVGKNCILNTKSLVEHDSVIEDHCHIATASIVNGDCVVKHGSFIGSNTVLKNGKVIEASSVITYGDKV